MAVGQHLQRYARREETGFSQNICSVDPFRALPQAKLRELHGMGGRSAEGRRGMGPRG